MVRFRRSLAIAVAATATMSGLPASAAGATSPRTTTTPSCDVLVTRDGTWDGLYKIATNGATSEVKLGNHPIDVVASSDGRTGYVAGYGTGEVHVVDIVAMRKLASIKTEPAVISLALSADDSTLYAAATGGVHVIDTVTRKQTRFITLASSPFAVELSPDGTVLYALLAFDNSLAVVDLPTGNIRSAAIPASAESAVLSPDGRFLYVTHRDIDKLSRIRTSDLRVDTADVGDAPRGIDITPNGSEVYVVNQDAHTVSVVDTQTLATSTIAVGDGAYDVTIDADGKRAYVNNYWEDSMSIIDTASRTVIGSLPLGAVNASWGIDTACRGAATPARPGLVKNLSTFANFFCGPCTTAWVLFIKPANSTDFTVFANGQPVSCAQKGYFFTLALCQLTALTPGVPMRLSVVPSNGSTFGATASTLLTLRP